MEGDEVFQLNVRFLKLWRDPIVGGHLVLTVLTDNQLLTLYIYI